MSDTLSCLLHPFETGQLSADGPAFFLRAECGEGLDDSWRKRLICEQSFKPAYDILDHQGFQVQRRIEGSGFALGLCLLSKHKAENLANMARAWDMLAPGGLLVCAGGNDSGAASLHKELKVALGVDDSLSKYHCRVFWRAKRAGEATPPQLTRWAEDGQLTRIAATGCFSRPGLYNWNKVDQGSALLVEHFPEIMTGRAADLGSGWGYLSLMLRRLRPQIVSVDLFEAEAMALEAAQANLEDQALSSGWGLHWCDVAAGIGHNCYDWVVMNPPFHSGKATDVDLGRAFIVSAARCLKPDGRLVFVANRQLPYEPQVEAVFKNRQIVAENNLYKIIFCSQPKAV